MLSEALSVAWWSLLAATFLSIADEFVAWCVAPGEPAPSPPQPYRTPSAPLLSSGEARDLAASLRRLPSSPELEAVLNTLDAIATGNA